MPVRKTKTRNCDECRHWHAHEIKNGWLAKVQVECDKAHTLRYFKPRGPMDTAYGWKRKCADFAPSNAMCTPSGASTELYTKEE
jgi:hypothetical protein